MILIPIEGMGQGPLGLRSDIVIDTRPAYVTDVSSSKPNGERIKRVMRHLVYVPLYPCFGASGACIAL